MGIRTHRHHRVHLMPLATKNGSLIVKDGQIAEDCECCGTARLYSWVGETLSHPGTGCTFQPHAYVIAPAGVPEYQEITLSYTITKTLEVTGFYPSAPASLQFSRTLTRPEKVVSFTGLYEILRDDRFFTSAWPANTWRVRYWESIGFAIQTDYAPDEAFYKVFYRTAFVKTFVVGSGSPVSFSGLDTETLTSVDNISQGGSCSSRNAYNSVFGDNPRVLRYSVAGGVAFP
jgi:hypothetical protein